MIFLIEYNRTQGEIVTFQRFESSERETAEDTRLRMELKFNRLGQTNEIVLLEASSEAALRKTHRRYFENLRQLNPAII